MATTDLSQGSLPDARPRRGTAGWDRRLVAGGVLAGVGLGGFVDGIVFHQILQWHHLLTGEGRYAGYPDVSAADLERNTLWDGLFHAGTWVATLAGIALIWSAAGNGLRLTGRRLAGLLLAGWGLFNLVEGTVLHHLLGVHHVRDDLGAPLGWDLGYLASGLGLLVVGALLARPARPAPAGRD